MITSTNHQVFATKILSKENIYRLLNQKETENNQTEGKENERKNDK
jgi:hypothetical protein